MGRALYRYQRKHFRHITLKRETYERLKRLANEKSMPMSELVRMLLDMYERGELK